jgi:hypothetical protein
VNFRLVDCEQFHRIRTVPRYSTIGAYALFYVMRGCECVCPTCVSEGLSNDNMEYLDATIHVNWESVIYCDECGERIESAYDAIDDNDDSDSEGA